MPYLELFSLTKGATVVLTDSGGLQEETAVLKVPCLTMRENTERPITVELGTSCLVGNDSAKITAAFHEAVSGVWKSGVGIPLWDGKAAVRVDRASKGRQRSPKRSSRSVRALLSPASLPTDDPEFHPVGEAMLAAWNDGVAGR